MLIIFIAHNYCIAQAKIIFGKSPMTTADENEGRMKKIVKKSYHLPFFAGDSVADTSLLKIVSSIHSKRYFYCVRYKDDTNRVVVAVKKLKLGYEVTSFWRNKYKRRVAHYNASYLLNGDYAEYYENGWFKCGGQYINGKRAGEWEYYNAKGDKISEPK